MTIEHIEPKDPKEALRRLAEDLDDELPDEEEARLAVARLGIDVETLTARVRARVRPPSTVAPRRRARPLHVALAIAAVIALASVATVGGITVAERTRKSNERDSARVEPAQRDAGSVRAP
jgi:hypothetical protein